MAVFNLGEDQYALDCSQVDAVIPQMQIRQLPHMPPYVAGVFNYHGTMVPVIDTCQLTLGRPCKRYYSTRIILVRYPLGKCETRLLGLLAENVTETIRTSPGDISPTGLASHEGDYVDGLIGDKQRLVGCIRIEGLLPEEVRDVLFADQPEQQPSCERGGPQ